MLEQLLGGEVLLYSKSHQHLVHKRQKLLLLVLPIVAILLLSGCTGETNGDESPSIQSSNSSNNDDEPSLSEEKESSDLPAEVLSSGYFNVSFANYDKTSYPNLEIWIRGHGSWFPNDGDSIENIGPFAIGQSVLGSFFIYPFGRSGIEVPVTLNLKSDHISNSDRDSVLIYIEGRELFIFGGPLDELEMQISLK